MRGHPGALADVGRSEPPRRIELAGGAAAPARARAWALSCLAEEPIGIARSDLELIVSELVTNSVVHAHVDESRTLELVIAPLVDRYRISVLDPACPGQPHVVRSRARAAGGLGLRLVAELSCDWGTFVGPGAVRHVWCELPRRQG